MAAKDTETPASRTGRRGHDDLRDREMLRRAGLPVATPPWPAIQLAEARLSRRSVLLCTAAAAVTMPVVVVALILAGSASVRAP